MDFWASLEHDIRYKVDKTKLPEGINEEMRECSGKIAEIDRKMQDMYRRCLLYTSSRAVPRRMGYPAGEATPSTRSRILLQYIGGKSPAQVSPLIPV